MTKLRWFTSDQHFGHANIIRYSRRPYLDVAGEPDVHAMNANVIARHNTIVAPDDEVWWLGDAVMGDKRANLACVRECVGEKIFITGNHDKNFRKTGDAPHIVWDEIYAELGGFYDVIHGTVSCMLGNNTEVLVSHFPYSGDSREGERYREHRPHDNGGWLLHGHVHEKWRQRGHQINVGVDAWGGYPVSEEQIIELIETGPQNLPPLTWK